MQDDGNLVATSKTEHGRQGHPKWHSAIEVFYHPADNPNAVLLRAYSTRTHLDVSICDDQLDRLIIALLEARRARRAEVSCPPSEPPAVPIAA